MDGKGRGEVGLAHSWWKPVCASVALVAAGLALTGWAAPALPPKQAFFLGLAAWFVVLVAATWPCVRLFGAGIALGRRRGAGGAGYPVAALAALALIGVAWAGAGFAKADMGRKLERVQTNLPITTPILVINDGTELVFDGNIEHGAAKALREVAGKYRAVKRIRLGGMGGELREARGMRDLIAEKGWDTYAAGICWSGCVIAYLGGARRTIGPEAQMGFHSVSIWPFGGDEAERAINELIAREMIDRGVDPAFARRAWSKGHDGMWFPSADELVRAGLVHEIAGR